MTVPARAIQGTLTAYVGAGAAVLLLACMTAAPSVVTPSASTTHRSALSPSPLQPSALLLTAADLSPGSIEDDALANPGATALASAYAPIVAASAFSGFRSPGRAVVETALILRSPAAAPSLIASETAAVGRTTSAALLTLDRRYGHDAPLAYTIRGTRHDHWVMTVVGAGADAVVLGVEGAGPLRQQTLTTLEHLAALVEGRLQAAGAASSLTIAPRVRVLTLATTLRDGRSADAFHPRTAVYWRMAWQITTVAPGTREQVYDAVALDGKTIYSNHLDDVAFAGENGAVDHVVLPAGRTGRCVVSLYIRFGRASIRAAHAFRVVPRPSASSPTPR